MDHSKTVLSYGRPGKGPVGLGTHERREVRKRRFARAAAVIAALLLVGGFVAMTVIRDRQIRAAAALQRQRAAAVQSQQSQAAAVQVAQQRAAAVVARQAMDARESGWVEPGEVPAWGNESDMRKGSVWENVSEAGKSTAPLPTLEVGKGTGSMDTSPSIPVPLSGPTTTSVVPSDGSAREQSGPAATDALLGDPASPSHVGTPVTGGAPQGSDRARK